MSWTALIKAVYEVDSLKCSGTMKIIFSLKMEELSLRFK